VTQEKKVQIHQSSIFAIHHKKKSLKQLWEKSMHICSLLWIHFAPLCFIYIKHWFIQFKRKVLASKKRNMFHILSFN